jgi:hypothetical protein
VRPLNQNLRICYKTLRFKELYIDDIKIDVIYGFFEKIEMVSNNLSNHELSSH